MASDPFPAQVFMQALAERAGGMYDREQERSVYGGLGPDVERDLEQRMGDMRVGGGGPGSRLTADYGAPPPLGGPVGVCAPARNSMSIMPVPTVGGSPLPGAVVPPGGGIMPGARGGKMYDDAEYIDRDYERDDYPLGPTANSRRASMHMGAGIGGRGGPSPYRSASPLPPVMNGAGMPVYPPGHIYEGEPISGMASGAVSRSHSPVPRHRSLPIKHLESRRRHLRCWPGWTWRVWRGTSYAWTRLRPRPAAARISRSVLAPAQPCADVHAI